MHDAARERSEVARIGDSLASDDTKNQHSSEKDAH
jgi:hypothetical protein